MMELGSSIIWYVHMKVLRGYISSDSNFEKFQVQPVTLNRSILDGSPLSKPLPPHIQPQYYAAIIAAEAIGNSGNTKIIELNIADTWISGYAFYQNDELTKVILINTLAFFKNSPTPRSSTHVNLTLATGTDVPSKMEVKQLFVSYVQVFFLSSMIY